MAAKSGSVIADQVRNTTAELVGNGVQLLAGALASGSLVVLQLLVSRAARTGGGPSFLGTLPFHVYVDLFAFGYVSMVAVVGMMLSYADTLRGAVRFLLAPVLAAVPLGAVLQLLGALPNPTGMLPTMCVALTYLLLWCALYRCALPPQADRDVLAAARTTLHVVPAGPAAFVTVFWQRWRTRRLALAGWISSPPPQTPWTSLTMNTASGAVVVDASVRARLHGAAQRISLLRLLFLLQLGLTGTYVACSSRARAVFDFDPRPLARLQWADSTGKPVLTPSDSVRAWDRIDFIQRIDSLTGRTGLQLAFVDSLRARRSVGPVTFQRYLAGESPASISAPVDSTVPSDTTPATAVTETTTATVVTRTTAATATVSTTVVTTTGRRPDNPANRTAASPAPDAAEQHAKRLFAANRFLLEQRIRTEWAHAVDIRHRWFGAMLGALLVIVACGLALGPAGEDPLRRSDALMSLTAWSERRQSAAPRTTWLLGLTREERSLAAVAVVVVSLLPMLRTVDPAALEVARPRSVFDGGIWSPIPLTKVSAESDSTLRGAADGERMRNEHDTLRDAITGSERRMIDSLTKFTEDLRTRLDRVEGRN